MLVFPVLVKLRLVQVCDPFNCVSLILSFVFDICQKALARQILYTFLHCFIE